MGFERPLAHGPDEKAALRAIVLEGLRTAGPAAAMPSPMA